MSRARSQCPETQLDLGRLGESCLKCQWSNSIRYDVYQRLSLTWSGAGYLQHHKTNEFHHLAKLLNYWCVSFRTS
jgi:hypothetical protein